MKRQKMVITEQLIYQTFEIDRLKQIKNQLEQENNQQLLKIVNRRLNYNRWEVVEIELGTPDRDLKENENYSKNEIIENLYGINLGVEFSRRHYGIILSPFFLNKEKITIIPITSQFTNNGREKYKCDYINIVCLDENNYRFLRKPSVALIDNIKTVDVKRASRIETQGKKFIFQIDKRDRKTIVKKALTTFFSDIIKEYSFR
jgi:mRNA-degrading endonuclease toxin of MazEF toxin-antitoxin module